jgi:hypothetical protein
VDFEDVDLFMDEFHTNNTDNVEDSLYFNDYQEPEEQKIDQYQPFVSSRISMSPTVVNRSQHYSSADSPAQPDESDGSIDCENVQSNSSNPEQSGQGCEAVPRQALDRQNSAWDIISRGEFNFGLNLLDKHKKWVERAARRSSIGFHRDHPSSTKEVMDRFLVALAGGTHVRRHQNGCVAETVRLFSTTGCQTVQWDKPRAKSLLAQRLKEDAGFREGRTDAIFVQKHDRSPFDCCVASKSISLAFQHLSRSVLYFYSLWVW